MLSKTSLSWWGRARTTLRGLLNIKNKNDMPRQLLLARYVLLTKEIEDVKYLRDLEGNEVEHPFKNARIVREEKRNEELESIFSLQNLKLLGTKEGPELARFQRQLQKSLDSIFSTSSNHSPTPSTTNNTHWQNAGSKIPPQTSVSADQNALPPQLTLEEKKEIERLADAELPKPTGFFARIFSWTKITSTRIEDADVLTLQQLIQDKFDELNALRMRGGRRVKNNTANNDTASISAATSPLSKPSTPSISSSTASSPSSSSPTYPFPDNTTSLPNDTNNKTRSDNNSNKNNNNNNKNKIVIPAAVLEQINHRKQLRAAGVPADQLPKLDLSGIPPQTLKQIYLAKKQQHNPSSPKDNDSNQIK